ncbi:TupA-like ATPgrasp-domain-containing protein [Neocallimastix lanati (nom. inval.)]|nr:TupA-like ATPgrasp-domain-containing protein [Neocallimastix sp. JGI-2020a]
MNKWLKINFAFKYGFEFQYLNIKPKIIAEKYIENINGDVYDYKVFCFNGKAESILVINDRKTKLKMSFYDLNWNKLDYIYSFSLNKEIVPKPKNLNLLIELAEKLAEGFSHVRVDFYILNDGTIKFGEMTFSSASGISANKSQQQIKAANKNVTLKIVILKDLVNEQKKFFYQENIYPKIQKGDNNMSRNRNNIPITIDDTDETLTKGITFNYSENFNRVIELSTENYPSWRTNILYLLMINNLEGYVMEEKIKKLRKRNLRDDLDNYLEDKFDPSLVYDKNTSLKDIKNDVMVKWIITNSLGENTKKIIEGNGKTAHQIWITLEKSFTMSPEKRKLEIKSKINIIVKNKKNLNIEEAKKKINKWMKINFAFNYGFEFQYLNIKPKIIAKEYMENIDGYLYDYKVFCFNGKAESINVFNDRNTKLKISFYDLKWNKLNYYYTFPLNKEIVPKPKNLNLLIELAEKLAEGFAHVRVDFYILNDGTIKFGEMTFSSMSGISIWKPIQKDKIFGDLIKLPPKKPFVL